MTTAGDQGLATALLAAVDLHLAEGPYRQIAEVRRKSERTERFLVDETHALLTELSVILTPEQRRQCPKFADHFGLLCELRHRSRNAPRGDD